MKNETQAMNDTFPASPYAMHRRWLLEDDCEHDDRMSAEDYDRRSAERDGWETGTWDGR